SRQAVAAQPGAFDNLQSVVDQMSLSWADLQASVSGELDGVTVRGFESEWAESKQNALTIVADKEKVIFLNEVADTLNKTLPQLQQEHSQVVETLLEASAPGDQVAVAQNQTWLAERIGRNVDKMLAGGSDAEAAADQFNRDANLFGRVLEGMKKGDPVLGISRVSNRAARANLDNITQSFEFVNNSIQDIIEATPVLFNARRASNDILAGSQRLLEQINDLSAGVAGLASKRTVNNQTALMLIALAIVFVAMIGFSIFAATRANLKETAEASEKNQEAILRLLDEIGDLGDGDLTTHATVTEDFTGAIADSINYAIDQLRILVAQIQETSENVSAAANETRATAQQLSDSANHQSEQISGVTKSISDMVQSIDRVSENAGESARVAEQSVSIASKGAEVVRNTIDGMDTIREQIQDTSKRIKRLGESSQEIGDIISLINDIADQTNILALNAAIQASMAGDAGRGFAVVADEVQRLAERSADATKQISGLVKAIQSDTNEAVISMEQTTTEVVKGAALAHDAGEALSEIEAVSASLERLIQEISTSAQEQTATASQVSRNMAVIQDITSQTLLGTQATADSTGELADLAVSLRESVSGFKLPAANDEGGVIAGLEQTAAALDEIPSESDALDEAEEAASIETDDFDSDEYSFGDSQARSDEQSDGAQDEVASLIEEAESLEAELDSNKFDADEAEELAETELRGAAEGSEIRGGNLSAESLMGEPSAPELEDNGLTSDDFADLEAELMAYEMEDDQEEAEREKV
ncbi:MAG: methyl-accepting chemotaxis protein, partial [bacterium]